MGKIIGIDLGTGNSCVAVFEGNEVHVIENSEGKRTTPSIVAFTKDGERKIGDSAKRQSTINPKNTIYEVKRLIGSTYDKCKADAESATYDVINKNGNPVIKANNVEYRPQEISAFVLQKMKQTAEDYLGETVSDAVITVPAYFDDDQRTATIDAGKIAGLNVKRIVNEPTAAALAYGINKQDKDMKIMVIDSGCGTLDTTLLEFGGGVFEVIGTGGNTHLGGKDVDKKISDWIVSQFKSATGIDISCDPMAMQRVKEAAENAKIELSSSTIAEINLAYLSANETGPKHFNATLSRAQFETMISQFIEDTLAPCKDVLAKAKVSVKDIDEILLVGGTTRIPALQNAIKNFFGKEPSKGVNPDEAVAIGAAIQGAILNKEEGVGDIVLLDVTPLSLGIETMGGVMTKLIDANTTIPCKKSEIFSTAADNQSSVEIHVLQGERIMAADNKQLGIFHLDGIPMAPRGVPQIEVTFDIDANGVISVTAKDKGTGKEQSIRIEASNSLTNEEIERMKADAEKFKDQDDAKRKELDICNNAESMMFNIEKNLTNDIFKDKITEEQKSEINSKIEALKKALSEKNISQIETCSKALNDTWNPIISSIYASQSQNNSNQQSGNPFNSNGFNPFDMNTGFGK